MWRRLLQLLLPGPRDPGPRFIIHKRYQIDVPFPEFDSRRPFRILSYLEKRGLLSRGSLQRPRPVSLKRLQTVHGAEYLRALEEPEALLPVLGFSVDAREQDRFLCFQRLVCGGTVHAARNALRSRGVEINLGGGFHHARRDAGSGFCVFNDVAVAVALLRRSGFSENILVIDLDLHDGDGTREIFADDATVHTFSLHNHDLGETRAMASTCVALGTGVDDETYLQALRRHLPAVLAEFQPGLVFYLAGSDPGIEDRMGDWRITLPGMLARDRFVMEQIPPAVPVVILLAGGYGRRAWRHGAAFFSWLLSGDSNLDIPPELELPLDHYRRLTRWMNRRHLLPDELGDGAQSEAERHGKPDDDWGLVAEDLDPAAAPVQTRFLGFFTRHAVEMALEDYGLMDRLRRLGFAELQISLDLEDPLGHMLRISTGGDDPLVLMEIKLRVDRNGCSGGSCLAVEWLLIQDAGSRYEMSRPLLPGQKYPGLGLLSDTAAVLIILCERLEMDALCFTPSHYHLASLSRPMASCPDPVEEGRFQSIQAAVAGLPLLQAARAVEDGLLTDGQTGTPLEWRPVQLFIPVCEDMKRRFRSRDYKKRVAAARAATRIRLD